MKKEYYNLSFGNVYSEYSEGSYYVEWTKLFVEETEHQKNTRLSKEKAEKRNNKIDQILGE